MSTQAIVEAAGVTRRALYHQFQDKADLFATLCEQVEEQLAADVVAALGAENDMYAVCDRLTTGLSADYSD